MENFIFKWFQHKKILQIYYMIKEIMKKLKKVMN